MIRFGKSSGALIAHKQDFFDANDALLAEGARIGTIYRAQSRRDVCKCCAGTLGAPIFSKQSIDYSLCDRCGHLNGGHDDSKAFAAAVYTEDGGANYARTYTADDKEAYHARVTDIYVPKAAFLDEALMGEGTAPEALSYADFGAGSGHFVAAMRARGWTESRGFEVSDVQAALGNSMIEANAILTHTLDQTAPLARSVDADVVSMVGVLEHLQAPRAMLTALRENPRVRYLFISVPLFSPCVFFEMVFPQVFQRQLSAGHTHLYTEASLDWTCREFGMERCAEWWFGTDIVDLFRSVSVELKRHDALRGVSDKWGALFAPAIDEMQLALDRRKLASEVHMLLRFNA